MQIRRVSVFHVLIGILITAGLSRASMLQAPRFLPGRQIGVVQTPLVTEASGIVASRKNPGVIWVHNDSGGPATIYAFSPQGELLATCAIKAARCLDWEDIALGPGPDPQQHYLYIGDIGDNRAGRRSITIYRVAEPKVDPNQTLTDMVTPAAESIELAYPDGPKDAETLMVDPLNGDIYVITKRDLFSRVYHSSYPQSTTELTTMDLVATLPWGLAVGGDISPDGNFVIVRGLFNAALWGRSEREELWKVFKRKGLKLELMIEPQGEGICFDAGGRGYFTIGEMAHAPIYYFARSADSDKATD